MALQSAYGKTAYKEVLRDLQKLYERKWERIADLNYSFISYISNVLNISCDLVLDEEVSGKKHELLMNICKKYSASTYVSGFGGKNYMSEEFINEMKFNGVNHEFIKKNITAEYPYSIVHYLLTNGPEWTKSIIS